MLNETAQLSTNANTEIKSHTWRFEILLVMYSKQTFLLVRQHRLSSYELCYSPVHNRKKTTQYIVQFNVLDNVL